ncbi:hypothetical protein [Halobacillus campisalis]|uniref:DUF4440 domain-containing protein n=1 Tax=Halobacillus campisalis TaxID=435909 RepID=A0ABW2K4K7_9BACI|nr:hypothetical protein [Halobacillus campisalis]
MGSPKKIMLFSAIALIPIAVTIAIFIYTSPEQQAKRIVESFYTYEQEGNFSDSWELLHPFMKEKFAKGSYLQDRAHVFMNHFGVTTFTFSLEGSKKIKNWTMEKDRDPIGVVYATTVIQTYKGKYGHFKLHQEVFVAKVEGEWVILWDYNK